MFCIRGKTILTETLSLKSLPIPFKCHFRFLRTYTFCMKLLEMQQKYTERKKKRRVEIFPSYFNHFFTVFTIAIHFYRLSCECEPRVYESLVDVLSTQCVKSFNRALHSALRKAKNSCKTSMFKPSAQDFLTPFGTLQRYTTIHNALRFFYRFFFSFLRYFELFFNHGRID